MTEQKRCARCGVAFHRKPRLSHAQWAAREYCSPSCSAKSRPRRIRYPELQDEAWLRARYVDDEMSFRAIAALLGCTDMAVRAAATRFGIAHRQRGANGWVRHGHVAGGPSRTYVSWRGMLARCYYADHVSYEYYGGRGVTVCGRWRSSFESFLADMGERPEGKTLDRIDPDGNYEPSNCRWATPFEQRHNQRDSRKTEVDAWLKGRVA